ncbi:P-loop containing nucleoside triphosphate hydrolase protein [Phaeosphaeriaceae sp. SRC1lsM3a]|nr:P-loop containing nucleoside triphosphate hydrolase protein [Stagonospora sp. SRC1lsM3a]
MSNPDDGKADKGAEDDIIDKVDATQDKDSPEIVYEIRYKNDDGEHVFSRPLPRPAKEIEQPVGVQPPVMKVVDVRSTWLESDAPEFVDAAAAKTEKPSKDSLSETEDKSDSSGDKTKQDKPIKLPPFESQLGSYIEITSPAVLEALRCVVDYAPGHDFGARSATIYWPYSILAHNDDVLAEYQKRFEHPKCASAACPNKHASRHIGIVRNFVKETIGTAIEDERKRHARGMATFEMLWLLYQPGIDMLADKGDIGEHQPYVMGTLDCDVLNGTIRSYSIGLWNMRANSRYIGPCYYNTTIKPFAGEVPINSLKAYPFEYRTKSKVWGEKAEARAYFEERGHTFYKLRKQGSWEFRGYTTTFPRRPVEGLVVSDPDQYFADTAEDLGLESGFETENDMLFDRHCCDDCREIIKPQRRPFKFSGYSNINPHQVSSLKDHQYFLCDRSAQAYVMKQRKWSDLDVAGFRPAQYDKNMLDTLVLEDPHVKELVRSLTNKYLLGLKAEAAREAHLGEKDSNVHDTDSNTAWSPDFVKGKGEGLIFLLHGKPGVGKTYTAECIAANAERPLLTVTCADIGTDPQQIEDNLVRFFKRAKAWNAILLIDEADIFMEHRRVQDLERNSLVAGFLRAMEYYQGILFLTTNRVGMFDEAFISRINLTIYYPPFSTKARAEVWESFFSKLEREREGKIRVHNNTRAYVEESDELSALQWNGREIRNAFQIAVALAETEGEKDSRGSIIIKKEHIRATVDMSKAFKKYLKELHNKDEDAMAALRGNRNDSRSILNSSEHREFR